MNPRHPSHSERRASPVALAAVVVGAVDPLGPLGSVGDPEGTRTITSIVALLIAIGIALVMVAVWLFKSTRPDPELLAPLEMMGERRWRRADPVWQRRRLDELRPEGARPLEPSTAPPDIDEAFDQGPTAPGFDDLNDDQDSGGGGVRGARSAVEASPGPSGLEADQADLDRMAAPTPQDLPRPWFDDLPDGELDPEALAAAMADLDAELGRRRSDAGSDTGAD